jgi:solute carrier family 25 uncoupling protein 8/9
MSVVHRENLTRLQQFGREKPVVAGFLSSSVSVATATFLTNWIDVIKVRQQLAGNNSRNMVATLVGIVNDEGLLALNKGVTPAVARGMLYGGMRIGLYNPIKTALSSDHDHSLIVKIGAGMTSGSIAAAVCNPTDLVKTRMQAQADSGAHASRSPMAVARSIVESEGVKGLWKGTTPSMARAALLTAAQCATYDEVKTLFLDRLKWKDSISTHLAVSGVAGLVTTTVIAPADMVKTHMFMNRSSEGGYSFRKCIGDIYATQGIRGMFKGWSANWARQGPMTTVVFVVNEAIRPAFGLGSI